MKKKTIYFLFLYLLFSAKGYTQTPGSQWVIYNYENSGMPSNVAIDVAFDTLNKPWIATDWGLAHFDGTSWEVFNNENAFPASDDNYITCIAVDHQNTKYAGIGSPWGYVYGYDDISWEFVSCESTMPLEMEVDKFNSKWVGYQGAGTSGLTIFSDTDTTVYTYQNTGGLLYGDIEGISIDNDAEPMHAWLTASNLTYFDEDTIIIFYDTLFFPSTVISYDVEEDKSGNIWMATDEGLVKFDGDTTWEVFQTSNSSLPDNWVRTVAEDKQGKIWAGTFNFGMACINGDNWTVYHAGNSPLPSHRVGRIRVDKFNNKWICTPNGLAIFNEGGVYVNERSTPKKKQSSLQILPNPASSQCKLIFNSYSHGTATLEIYNPAGNRVFLDTHTCKAGTNALRIDVGYLPKGLYVVKLIINKEIFLSNLIKQ